MGIAPVFEFSDDSVCPVERIEVFQKVMSTASDVNYLRARLVKLDPDQQLVFGTVCCERLLPNYIAFQKDAGWGDITPVRKALDFVWLSLGVAG